MLKQLISCGCSFSSGYTLNPKLQITPYPKILANQIGYEYKNLSQAGASNYFIAKQIEHSLTLNPSLVVINATTPIRYDFVNRSPQFTGRTPTYDDFNHDTNKYERNKIESRTLMFFKGKLDNRISLTPTEQAEFKQYAAWVTRFANYEIKADSDKFILLGALSLLDQENIPYVVLDFANILTHSPSVGRNVLLTPCGELAARFPIPKDPYHVNEKGMHYLASLILAHLKKTQIVQI